MKPTVSSKQSYYWLFDIKSYFQLTGIPICERFSFCLNTALSDIAYYCPEYSDKIINEQIFLIESLSDIIFNCKDVSSKGTSHTSQYFIYK